MMLLICSFLKTLFFAKSMYELALFSSNIYIIKNSLKHSNKRLQSVRQFVTTHTHKLGEKINAVENFKERYGRHINFRMDFTR